MILLEKNLLDGERADRFAACRCSSRLASETAVMIRPKVLRLFPCPAVAAAWYTEHQRLLAAGASSPRRGDDSAGGRRDGLPAPSLGRGVAAREVGKAAAVNWEIIYSKNNLPEAEPVDHVAACRPGFRPGRDSAVPGLRFFGVSRIVICRADGRFRSAGSSRTMFARRRP